MADEQHPYNIEVFGGNDDLSSSSSSSSSSEEGNIIAVNLQDETLQEEHVPSEKYNNIGTHVDDCFGANDINIVDVTYNDTNMIPSLNDDNNNISFEGIEHVLGVEEEHEVVNENKDNNIVAMNEIASDDEGVVEQPSPTKLRQHSPYASLAIDLADIQNNDEVYETFEGNEVNIVQEMNELSNEILTPIPMIEPEGSIENRDVEEQQQEEEQDDGKKKKKRTPLPKGDLFAIMVCFMCEGFSYTFVFPFVGYMIIDFGLVTADDQAGKFTGVMAGCFSATQFFTGFIYGYFADKASKKLVILISTVCCIGLVLMFGFSPNYAVAVIARTLHGGLNGNVAVVKAHLADLTDETNQALGFSLLGMSWALGAVGGPVIGGYLAKPVEKYGLKSKVFTRFHYALPCIVIAGLLAISALVTAVFMSHRSPYLNKLREEKKLKKEQKKREKQEALERSIASPYSPATDDSTYNGYLHVPPTPQTPKPFTLSPASPETGSATPTSMGTPVSTRHLLSPEQSFAEVEEVDPVQPKKQQRSFKEKFHSFKKRVRNETVEYVKVLTRRNVIITVTLFFLSSCIDTFQEELFPLWSLVHPTKGGISFGSSQIATVQLVIGALMLSEPFIFPLMDRALGSLWSLRVGFLCIIPLTFIPHIHYAVGTKPGLWTALVVYAIIRAFTCFLTFTAVYILINNSAPQGSAGRVMSFSNSAGCLAKVVAPFSAGPMFAAFARVAKRQSLVYLNFPFAFCAFMSLCAFFLTFTLPRSINKPYGVFDRMKAEKEEEKKKAFEKETSEIIEVPEKAGFEPSCRVSLKFEPEEIIDDNAYDTPTPGDKQQPTIEYEPSMKDSIPTTDNVALPDVVV